MKGLEKFREVFFKKIFRVNKTLLSITLSYKRLVNRIIEKRTPPQNCLCCNNHSKQSQKTNYKLGNSTYSPYRKG